MNGYDWQDELNRVSILDPWVRECQDKVNALTPQYLALLEVLPPPQREALDDYIAACEELEHSKTLLAYQLGLEQRPFA